MMDGAATLSTDVIGTMSELYARQALLYNGWKVATSESDEAFDIVAKEPGPAGEWRTIQVKTIQVREDRRGEYVIPARRSNGDVYTTDEAHYFIGVKLPYRTSGEALRVFLVKNRGISEYWAAAGAAEAKWTELKGGWSA